MRAIGDDAHTGSEFCFGAIDFVVIHPPQVDALNEWIAIALCHEPNFGQSAPNDD